MNTWPRCGLFCCEKETPSSKQKCVDGGRQYVLGQSVREQTCNRARKGVSNSYLSYKSISVRATNDKELEIENLSTNYCDDFVCTSSPAVETTVRSLARDIERGNGVWTQSFLSRDVEYEGTFRKMYGMENFTIDYVPKAVKPDSITVKSMRMVDQPPSSRARLDWQLRGTVSPGIQVDVDMTTEVTLNLLTGQIEKRQDSWSVTRCSTLGKAAWVAALLTWALSSSSRNARDATSSALESLTTSMDLDDNVYHQADPTDPTKFFQQRDSFKDDAISLIAFLLVLYIIIVGYSTLFAPSSSSF